VACRGCAWPMCSALGGDLQPGRAIWRLIQADQYFSHLGYRRSPTPPTLLGHGHERGTLAVVNGSACAACATPIKLGTAQAKMGHPPPGDRHPGNAQRHSWEDKATRWFAGALVDGLRVRFTPPVAGLDGPGRPFAKVSLLNLFFFDPMGRCWNRGQISDPHRNIFPVIKKGRLFRP